MTLVHVSWLMHNFVLAISCSHLEAINQFLMCDILIRGHSSSQLHELAFQAITVHVLISLPSFSNGYL